MEMDTIKILELTSNPLKNNSFDYNDIKNLCITLTLHCKQN